MQRKDFFSMYANILVKNMLFIAQTICDCARKMLLFLLYCDKSSHYDTLLEDYFYGEKIK